MLVATKLVNSVACGVDEMRRIHTHITGVLGYNFVNQMQ
jgi:hypothetical protein